jgi:transcription elongation factor Elf1
MTETLPTIAPTTHKPRGFAGLTCLKCGEEGALSIRLDVLDDAEALHCSGCEQDYGLADVRDAVAAWTKLLAWADLAPELSE